MAMFPLRLLPATLLLVALGAQAQDAAAGRTMARACTPCHGPIGLSNQPEIPNLAGQPPAYITAQLRAFRAGTRRNEVMAVMAKPLTDDEIANLAAWFSSIHLEAQAPP
jgi:cytochrome c553